MASYASVECTTFEQAQKYYSSTYKYTITYEVGNFAVVPYSEVVNTGVKHTTPNYDLELVKAWAKYLANALDPEPYLTASIVKTVPHTYTHLATEYPYNESTTWRFLTASGTAGIGSSGGAIIKYFPTTVNATYGSGGSGVALAGMTLNVYSVPVTDRYVVVKRVDIDPNYIPVPVKPQVVLYDGLTKEECLAAFVKMQRCEGKPTVRMTVKQLEIARIEWSVELRKLSLEKADKERLMVVVDQDE